MGLQNSIVDTQILHQIEQSYRCRLESEPEDMRTRLCLAWCLFIQALHQAGQESILGSLITAGETEDAAGQSDLSVLLDKGSHRLLQDCLRQAFTVAQLSRHTQDVTEAETLQMVVKLSGGEPVLSEAEKQVVSVLSRLAQDVLVEPNKGDTTENAV